MPRNQGYDIAAVEGTEAATNLFFLSHLHTIKIHYPKLYDELIATLQPTIVTLKAEQEAWIQKCDGLINDINKAMKEARFPKKMMMCADIRKKLKHPKLLDQRHHVTAVFKALEEGGRLRINPDLVELLVLTDAETAAGVRDLSDKQKFGLALLLIKGKQKKAKVTNDYRTVRYQAELMVENHLIVNHPDWRVGATDEVEKTKNAAEQRVKSLAIYVGLIYNDLAIGLAGIMGQGNPYALLAAKQAERYGDGPVPQMTEGEIEVWAKEATKVLLDPRNSPNRVLLKALIDAATEKVKDGIDAYVKYEADLAAANSTEKKKKILEDKPDFPANHSSGNVVDLHLKNEADRVVGGPFSLVLGWGVDKGIVENFRAEGSHIHIVMTR